MSALEADPDQHRRECEARDWIRQGYTTEKDVNALMLRIAGKRGSAAANQLREEMRRQWRLRRQWLEGAR